MRQQPDTLHECQQCFNWQDMPGQEGWFAVTEDGVENWYCPSCGSQRDEAITSDSNIGATLSKLPAETNQTRSKPLVIGNRELLAVMALAPTVPSLQECRRAFNSDPELTSLVGRDLRIHPFGGLRLDLLDDEEDLRIFVDVHLKFLTEQTNSDWAKGFSERTYVRINGMLLIKLWRTAQVSDAKRGSARELLVFTSGFQPTPDDNRCAIDTLLLVHPNLSADELFAAALRVESLAAKNPEALVDSAIQRTAKIWPDCRLSYAVRGNHRPGEHLVIIGVWL